MAIKSNLEKHTISWLIRQDAEGKLNKNISIQRKEVWDVVKKSNLIVSLLMDIPIESLLFEEAEDESYNLLDGKQRTLTLCAFANNGFALSPKIRIKEIAGQQLVGKTFKDFSKEMQERITEYELSISILRPLDEEDRATVFFMRNQAVSLSKMDLSVVILGQKAMNIFAELCNHNFMSNIIKLTEPARRKYDDLQILLQFLMLCNRPDAGFSGAEIMSFCDDIKNGEVTIGEEEVTKILGYLDDALLDKRQYLKKVHVPIVLFTAREAVQKNIPAENFGAALDYFFEKLPDNTAYMESCKSGSSKRTHVQVRIHEMKRVIKEAKAL
jgi:hypothetical protein